ncbi:MAG: UDP-3-O-(3-hydroxymyristoyl)glucosamine N-acyltransferase [Phaeodactylibacter sp.]|nr:UDP-3-O-(3-hydroxymyristoyl)glucosamine N-acyltransferase [Phaeodactylibacter sp.]
MKFEQPIPVKSIAEQIGAKLIGDDTLEVTGINEIHKVEAGDITFVDVKKYFNRSLSSPASVIILNEKVKCPKGKALLLCDNPFEAYNGLVKQHRPFRPLSANIAATAKIHPSAIIEPGVVIAEHVEIGADCYIQANAYIGEFTLIKERVTVQAGAIIGTDAFYYKRTDEGLQKWRSGGRVILENDVEIGAGSTINKGVSGDTIIGEGTKLDCQVHVGHGVVIGKHCLLAGQVGIGGKTIIGDHVILYGQVGVAQSLHIGDNATVYAKGGVPKDLEGGKVYFGSPAGEAGEKFREVAALRHLPEFLRIYYK